MGRPRVVVGAREPLISQKAEEPGDDQHRHYYQSEVRSSGREGCLRRKGERKVGQSHLLIPACRDRVEGQVRIVATKHGKAAGAINGIESGRTVW